METKTDTYYVSAYANQPVRELAITEEELLEQQDMVAVGKDTSPITGEVPPDYEDIVKHVQNAQKADMEYEKSTFHIVV